MTYGEYVRLSQIQRMRRLQADFRRGLSRRPLFVFDPWAKWRCGFDTSQTCEFFRFGPFWIEWHWE